MRALAAQSGTKQRALLTKLKALEVAIESEIDHLEDSRRRRIVGPRARVRTAIYTIEDSPRGPALTERRDSGARPFKCPKPVYETIAGVIADSREPLSFFDIKASASKKHRQKLPDYVIRTPLRFWSTLGVVVHQQARFVRVGTKAEFTRNSRLAWMSASKEQIQVDAG